MTAVAPPVRRLLERHIDVRVARTPQEFARIIAIREVVFRDEQGIVDALVTDRDDHDSVHAYALAGDDVVAIGRLSPPTGRHPEGQIAWVATLPAFRRMGFAEAIMLRLLEIADGQRFPSVLLSAQTHALPFYAQFGFVPYGKRFEVRKIEHQYMERIRPG